MASDNTRGRVLETAGEVFAEKGFEAATVREICEMAEVNLAAVNYYFGGKEALYEEALQRAHLRNIHDDNQPAWEDDTPPEARLRLSIQQLLARMLAMNDDPWESRLLIREIMNPSPAGKRVLGDRFRKGFRELQEILDEILPPDMPAHQRHQFGFSIIGQCALYRWLTRLIPLMVEEQEFKEHYGVEELAAHIAHVSLAALGLTSPLMAQPPEKAKRSRRLAAGAEARTMLPSLPRKGTP
jgi:TetR/AcrR family transcriptional regulator, regulator of cefoperazone and chloramphenicol sensitivity